MSRFKFVLFVALLLGMVAGVLALAVSNPTPAHLLLAGLFLLLGVPLIRTAMRLYGGQGGQGGQSGQDEPPEQ